MMTSRERVKVVFEGGIPDRVPIHDGYWDDALQRWTSEGLPPEVAADKDDRLGEFLQFDVVHERRATGNVLSWCAG